MAKMDDTTFRAGREQAVQDFIDVAVWLSGLCVRLEDACDRLERLQPKSTDPQSVTRPRPGVVPDKVTINLAGKGNDDGEGK